MFYANNQPHALSTIIQIISREEPGGNAAFKLIKAC